MWGDEDKYVKINQRISFIKDIIISIAYTLPFKLNKYA